MTLSSRERLLLERITMNPNILNGMPIIRGKWLRVEVVLALLAEAATDETVLKLHPALELDDILAYLAYAHCRVAGKEMPTRFMTTDSK